MSIAGLALWALVALIVLVGLGFFARAVCDNPRNDPNTGMLSALLRLYTRLVHRVRYEGLSLIPPAGEPTLFVCNHTAGIDPMLVHLVSGHDIGWMMARDMRTPILETFWNWMRIIDVDRIAGEVEWITRLRVFENEDRRRNRIAWVGPVMAGGRLFLTSSNGSSVIIDATDGSILRSFDLNDDVYVAPIIANETIYVVTDEGRLIALR